MNNLLRKILIGKREVIFFSLMLFFILSFPITFNLNSFSIICLVLFFFIDNIKNLKLKFLRIKKNRLIQILTVYFFINLIGLCYTENLKAGEQLITRLLAFLFLPSIILSENLSHKSINLLIDICKIWLILIFFYFIGYQYLVEGREIGTTVHFAFKKIGLSHHYISILLVVLIMHAITNIFNKNKIRFNVFLTFFLAAFLLLLSSRTNLILLIFSLLFFLNNRYKKVGLKTKVITFLFSLFFVFLALYSSPELKKKTNRFIKTTDFNIEIIKTKNSVTFAKNTIEHRILINQAAFKIIKTSPIIGLGTGSSVTELYKEYKKINFIAGIKQRFNTHNQYLENFIELGVFGFICIILLMFITIKEGFKKKSLLFYSAIGVAFLCFFESFFTRHHGVSFYAFFIPLFYKLELLINSTLTDK